jgi:hypothetical protein
MTSLCQFSSKEANEFHDKIVEQLANELNSVRNSIAYPDKESQAIRLPDLSIEGELVIEVKFLNPTKDDWIVELAAREAADTGDLIVTGGTLATRPLQQDIEDALEQFRNRMETCRLLVLVSPMEYQLRPMKLRMLLGGITHLSIGNDTGNVNRERKINVPVKQRTITQLHGILYIYGEQLQRRHLWILQNGTCELIQVLCDSRNTQPFIVAEG